MTRTPAVSWEGSRGTNEDERTRGQRAVWDRPRLRRDPEGGSAGLVLGGRRRADRGGDRHEPPDRSVGRGIDRAFLRARAPRFGRWTPERARAGSVGRNVRSGGA